MFVSRNIYHVQAERFRFNPVAVIPLFLVLGFFTGIITGMLKTF